MLNVTILILVDGFLQYKAVAVTTAYKACHNPYFSRWFSAIAYDAVLADSDLLSQSLF